MNADKWQATTFRVGAAFDAAFGLAMLLAPGAAARLLHLQLPADRTYFSLAGLLLLILAGLYVVAAGSPSRHPLALVTGLGRMAGMLLLFHAARNGAGDAFCLAGVTDGLLGASHLTLALLSRRAPGPWSVGDGPPDRT